MTDLHFENLIWHDGFPVFIDLENSMKPFGEF